MMDCIVYCINLLHISHDSSHATLHAVRTWQSMDCADEPWFAGQRSRAELDAILLSQGTVTCCAFAFTS